MPADREIFFSVYNNGVWLARSIARSPAEHLRYRFSWRSMDNPETGASCPSVRSPFSLPSVRRPPRRRRWTMSPTDGRGRTSTTVVPLFASGESSPVRPYYRFAGDYRRRRSWYARCLATPRDSRPGTAFRYSSRVLATSSNDAATATAASVAPTILVDFVVPVASRAPSSYPRSTQITHPNRRLSFATVLTQGEKEM